VPDRQDENADSVTRVPTTPFSVHAIVVDEAWRERGFNSRSEYIRYALRDAVNHPEGAGFWKDLAISEAQFDEGEGISSNEIKQKHGLDGE